MKIDIETDRFIFEGGRLMRINNYNQIYYSLDDFLARHVRFRMWLSVLLDEELTILTWKHWDHGVLRRIELDEAVVQDEFEGYPVLTLGIDLSVLRRDRGYYNGNTDLIYMNLPGTDRNVYTCVTNCNFTVILKNINVTYSLENLNQIRKSAPKLYFYKFGDYDCGIAYCVNYLQNK